VQVNDLYALLKPRRSEFQGDNDVHFRGGANVLMAKQVADCILQNLSSATRGEIRGKPGGRLRSP